MAKIKVKRSFKKLVPTNLNAFAKNTVNKMTGNAQFPLPDVPPATITAACSVLDGYLAAAIGGGKLSKAQVKAQTKVVCDWLDKQAAYVDRIANGSLTIIEDAGFEGTKITLTAKPLPSQVIIKKWSSIEKGTIKINFSKVQYATGIIAIAAQPGLIDKIDFNNGTVNFGTLPANALLSTAYATGHSIEFNGLQSETRYEVIVFGFNARGKGENSNRLSILVQ